MHILKSLTRIIGLLHVECLLPQIVCLLLIPVSVMRVKHWIKCTIRHALYSHIRDKGQNKFGRGCCNNGNESICNNGSYLCASNSDEML
jgi:hypothetical protein